MKVLELKAILNANAPYDLMLLIMELSPVNCMHT